MEVSVRELKARLSSYLRRAHNGEEIRITKRGKEVARLTPVPPSGGTRNEYADAGDRLRTIPGLIEAEEGKPLGMTPPLKLDPKEKSLSRIVMENRG